MFACLRSWQLFWYQTLSTDVWYQYQIAYQNLAQILSIHVEKKQHMIWHKIITDGWHTHVRDLMISFCNPGFFSDYGCRSLSIPCSGHFLQTICKLFRFEAHAACCHTCSADVFPRSMRNEMFHGSINTICLRYGGFKSPERDSFSPRQRPHCNLCCLR